MKEIKLTKGFVAFVSDDDYERVNAFKWYASVESRGTKVYAKRWNPKSERGGRWTAQTVRMSHFVMDIAPGELPEGHIINHTDDDGLNNQRENLTIISQNLNMQLAENWKKKPIQVEEEICL